MLAVALAAMTMVACNKNDQSEPAEPQLEVNANNISGNWELVKWNESELEDGTYVYINFVRNGKTYTMYQNYDHDSGDWAHRYIVKSLTATKMVFVAKDDATFVQEFARISEIPVEPSEN